MKTYLIYGTAMAIAGALLALLLYAFGLHSDPAKLGTAQAIGTIGGIAIAAVCITFGTKERRAEILPSQEFGYGQAVFAGFMITLIASLLGIVTWIVYATVINPEFNDIVLQAQMEKLEARGLRPEQIEAAERGMRMMMKPPIQAVFSFLGGLVMGTIVSLITAAFLKRPAAPIEAEAPPALS